MKDKKINTLVCTAQWLAALTGSIYGLVLAIFGYLSGWGPGGSMNGPFWRVLLSAAISILAGAFIGTFVVRKLARLLFEKPFSKLESGLRAFALVLAGSFPAFVSSWLTGYIMGKLTGTIEGLDWITVLVYTPLMSFIYGIPVCFGTDLLFGIFVFFYLKDVDDLRRV
ncbi:MAG TPA: hypothetical protein PLW31_08040 [Bacteroidales bacterium]|nr:hypothetical protein [Bacteroidales bacterium]HOX77976.1 hypothetical protein [Bacteroidales bacterium]HPI85952.1 hypothetical protein [Bacteroidales bacterium]HPM92822.1 hypothetical protein [Bacteroidales bacterium]